MKLSRVRHIIKEEIQKLHEVKPFVDPKLKTKTTDPVQYIATNDHRYPSEIAFFDSKKNEVKDAILCKTKTPWGVDNIDCK